MTLCNCNFRCNCTLAAVIASVILGVVTAFLQITAVITVTPAFLLGALGIAIAFLGVLVVAAALVRRMDRGDCLCAALNTVLTGILGTVLFSVVLLAVGIVATSVLSAILVALLAAFFALTVSGTACLVKSLTDCGN